MTNEPSANPTVTCYCPECKDSWEVPLYTPVKKYSGVASTDLSLHAMGAMFGRRCPSCCIPVKYRFQGEG